MFSLFIFWSLLLNRDNGMGVRSYCQLVSTVENDQSVEQLQWVKVNFLLLDHGNLSEWWQCLYLWLDIHGQCHWLSTQLDLHLRLYFSCSVTIDWVCLWILLRKTLGTRCLDRCRMACFLQTILEQVQLPSSVFWQGLCMVWSIAYFPMSCSIRCLTSEKWLRVSTQHLLLESRFLILPLLSPPSDLAAFINVCSVQMSHQVPDHSWLEEWTTWFPWVVKLLKESL